MKKQKYNENKKQASKAVAHEDKMKRSVKKHGAVSGTMKKQEPSSARHKQISGPSEMHNKLHHGKAHKKIEGPGAMKQDKLDGKEPSRHEASMVEKDMHSYLGKFQSEETLRRGHHSLEKVVHGSDEHDKNVRQDEDKE